MSKIYNLIKKSIKFIVPFSRLRKIIKRLIVIPRYIRYLGPNKGISLLRKIWLKDFTARLLNRNDLISVSIPHLKAPILLRLNGTDVPIFEQIFVFEEYNIPMNMKPKLIVDGGANVGYASIYFANRFPDAKIIAVEPAQPNIDVLKKNVSSYSQVTIIPGAIWNEKMFLENSTPYNGKGGAGFRVSRPKLASDELINSITIEDIIQFANEDRISILKLDVEGAEQEIFSASENWINKVDMIIVELHDQFKPGCKEAFELSTAEQFEFQGMYGENIVKTKKI